MSAPSLIATSALEAKVLGEIELAIGGAAVRALRARVDKQRKKVADGSSIAGDSGVLVRSPEAAMATKLADAFEGLAAEIEAEVA